MPEPSLMTAAAIAANVDDELRLESDLFPFGDDMTFINNDRFIAKDLSLGIVSGASSSECQATERSNETLHQSELHNSGVMLGTGDATAQVSPLHMAIQGGSVSIVRTLLEYGADCNARDSQNLTPLMYTIIENQESMADMLLLHGVCITALDSQNRSALHWAVIRGRDAILKLLIKHCKNDRHCLDSFDARGMSPLHTAISLGLDNAVEILCEAGANVQLQAKLPLIKPGDA